MKTNPTMQIPLEGVWNLRDLGGRSVASGGHTRAHRVFRSGTLWFATMQDCTVLAGFRFDTIIDLRLPQEELREEDWLCELLDTRYYHLPIEVPDDPSPIALVHIGGMAHYLRLLEHNATSYVRALELISDPDNHPVLFHCAAGQDRTGVLAALVLGCLGVHESAILADYVESEVGVHHIVDRYTDHPLYGDASTDAAGRRIDAAVMAQFLDQLGGSDGLQKWALSNGFAEESLDRMRTELIGG